MTWNKHWSEKLQEDSYKMLNSPKFLGMCPVKHYEGGFGVAMRYDAKDGSWIVALSNNAGKEMFDSLDALLAAGWAID